MIPYTTTCIKPTILQNKQLGKELSGLGSPGRDVLGWSIVQYKISTTDVLRFGQINVFLIWTSQKEVAEIHHLKPFGFVFWDILGYDFGAPKYTSKHTLPESNIAPEEWWLGDCFPFWMAYFQRQIARPCLNFCWYLVNIWTLFRI